MLTKLFSHFFCTEKPYLIINNKFFSRSYLLWSFLQLSVRFIYLFGFQWAFVWSHLDLLVGPSGLEPPTSCLSGTRSNLLSYEPMWLVSDFLLTWFRIGNGFIRSLSCVGIELSSRAASSQVLSPLQSLTSVFGMGTGGPSAFVTPTSLNNPLIIEYWTTLISRIRSSRLKSFELTR